MKKISVILGTRPEAIKLAPVIHELRRRRGLQCHVCVTGQHRQMLDQVLEVFEIVPDCDLQLMEPGQTLAQLTSRSVAALDVTLGREKPDFVVVQGDTTTVFCAALVSFYHHIPVGHVEAGLRTWNLDAPWPEEANRVLTSRIVQLHFAPTEQALENLRKEGVPRERIFVTGNTVVDALMMAREKVRQNPPDIPGLPAGFLRDEGTHRMVLITGHRRENFGQGFENICRAIVASARRFPDVQFVYPVHLNQQVREPVNRIIREAEAQNVHLLEPLSYLQFVRLLSQATVVLTDSGGVQEEAPCLGKPVLVMRDTTERPEAVSGGTACLVGTDRDRIEAGIAQLLSDPLAYERMARAHSPYGDGTAASKIADVLESRL